MKLLEKVFGLKRQRLDEATTIRQELREEVKQLNAKIQDVHAELDTWKSKYYELVEINAALRGECQLLRAQVEAIREGR